VFKQFAVSVLLAIVAVAQTGTSKPAGSPAQAKPHMTAEVKPSSVGLPTKQEAESFLRHMFGYDPNTQYQVLGISNSEVPGIARVTVQVGGPQAPPVDLYIMPDHEHAIAGQVLPFGADPFTPIQRRLDAQAKGPRMGAAQPRVTIVEFSDLQCPHCKRAQPVVDKLVADTPGARLIFQPFPLSIHDWALKAASMGECVAEQKPEAFWSYVKSVYDAQDQITAANASQKLQELAKSAGADPQRTSTCAASQAMSRNIQDSVDLGTSLGVTGTPTVFINGRKVGGIADMPYDQLRKLTEFEATQK
jgi:protein-disulfide isomerase